MQEDRQEPDDGVPNDVVPDRKPPNRKILTLALLPIVIFIGGGTIINVFFRGYLTAEHPLALLALNPKVLNMLLAEPRVESFEYYAVVLLRKLACDPSYFFLGVWFGHRAIAWVKKQQPNLGDIAIKIEGWFPKYGWLLVLLYPHEIVMIIAGASRMRFRTFIILDIIGIMVVSVLVQLVGHLIEDQVRAVNGFISDYWVWLTVVSIALFAITSMFGEKEERVTTSSIREELEGPDEDPLDKPRNPREPKDYS